MRGAMWGSIRGVAVAICLSAFVLSSLPTESHAARAPKAPERRAISKVMTNGTPKTYRSCIRAWSIKISTFGPAGPLHAFASPLFKTSAACAAKQFNGGRFLKRPKATANAWKAGSSTSGGDLCIDLAIPAGVYKDLLKTPCVASDPRGFMNGDGEIVERPTGTIDVSGTGYLLISDTTWNSWGDRIANGQTTFSTNSCDPTCADGNFVQQPAKVTFTGNAMCAERYVYTGATIVSATGTVLHTAKFSGLGLLESCTIISE